MSRPTLALLALTSLMTLAGCDLLGIEGATVVAERKVAEGKAVGAACRHAGRAIEDCYALNKKAEKAAIYAGWREMDDYMRENKLEPVAPQIVAETKSKPPEPEDADAEAETKPKGKGEVHADAKDKAPSKKPAAH
ncbi:MAG: hypothetical protein KAZ63_00330 [Vitreoscilla sp.]|jgi:hypothetical protein|nr:hypothetical protein [Vitreoscilla sp.]